MFLQSVKSAIDIMSGTTQEAGVTQAELEAAIAGLTAGIEGGTITVLGGGSGSGTTEPPDTTPPGSPTGLVATGGFSSVILSWDTVPPSPPVAFTTIYRAAVDDFGQAFPVGTSRVLLYSDYVPDSQDYYYWITFTTEAGIEGAPNSGTGTIGTASLDPAYTKEVLEGAITDLEIAAEKLTGSDVLKDLSVTSAVIGDAAIITAKINDAAIVTAHIQDAAIVDAKIQTLGADKIVSSSLSAVNANLGTVTAGLLLSPDATFKVDLSNKEILVTGPAGQAADDYTIIRNGSIEAYQWTGTGHRLAKALRGLETGIANNGATVTLSNYFRNQPRIIVSPANLPTYLQAFTAQDQTMQCVADNIVETPPGSGTWQFDAIARLIVSGGTEVQSPALSIADSQLNTLTSDIVATISDLATSLTVGISTRSYRETTTAGTFFYRQSTVTLQYRPTGTSTWLIGESKVVNYTDETSFVNTTLSVGSLPADQYDARIEAVYSDSGGTFEGSGGGLVPQPPVTRTASPVSEYREIISIQSSLDESGNAVLQSWTPPAGAVITNVEYSYDYTAFAWAAHRNSFGQTNSFTSTEQFGSGTVRAQAVDVTNDGFEVQQTNNGSGLFNSSDGTYDTTAIGWNIQMATSSNSDSKAQIDLTNIQAVIDYSLPATSGDQDPHNWLNWNTLTATLSGSQVLSTGTLNWLAVGES